MFSYKGSPTARKFTLRMGLALALSASMTGCAVGPKYRRPTVKLEPFHNAPSIEARTTSLPAPPLDQWWTGFRDPELTQIVKRALDPDREAGSRPESRPGRCYDASTAGACRCPRSRSSAHAIREPLRFDDHTLPVD